MVRVVRPLNGRLCVPERDPKFFEIVVSPDLEDVSVERDLACCDRVVPSGNRNHLFGLLDLHDHRRRMLTNPHGQSLQNSVQQPISFSVPPRATSARCAPLRRRYRRMTRRTRSARILRRASQTLRRESQEPRRPWPAFWLDQRCRMWARERRRKTRRREMGSSPRAHERLLPALFRAVTATARAFVRATSGSNRGQTGLTPPAIEKTRR